MKLRILPSAVVILSLLAFVTGCLKKEPAEVVTNDEADSAIAMQPVPPETTDPFAPGEDDPDEDGISEAPISGIALEQSVPKKVQTSQALSEIIK